MKKLLSQIIIASVILGFTKTPLPIIQNEQFIVLADQFSPNQLIVKFSTDISSEIKNRSIRWADAKIVTEIPAVGVIILKVPDGEEQTSIGELLQQPGVIYAEPNYYAEITDVIPNDPSWNNQYNLTAICAPAGWELNTGAIWTEQAFPDCGSSAGKPLFCPNSLVSRGLGAYSIVRAKNLEMP